MEVQLTEEGATGVLFDGVPERFRVLQWHKAEVKRLPPGGRCLATSPDSAVQAMQWGPRACSLQCHVEVETGMVENWVADPVFEDALEKVLGAGGAARLSAACEAKMPAFNDLAERLYINWLQLSAQT